MHKQAALNTAKLIALALVASLVGAAVVHAIPFETLMYIAGFGIMGYLVYVFYSIEKSRLESLERLNKTVDQ